MKQIRSAFMKVAAACAMSALACSGSTSLAASVEYLDSARQDKSKQSVSSDGEQKAMALSGYLRNHPDAIAPETSASRSIVRARLADTLAAVQHGDYPKAGDLALSAERKSVGTLSQRDGG